MTTWIFFAVLIPSFISLLGTEAVRRYAIRTRMVDIPNHRSSHKIPTPRGGGIAMVVGIVAMLTLLAWLLPQQRESAIGILGGGLMVAVIGVLDDRFELSARIRLVVQGLASVWMLAWVGGLGSFSTFGLDESLVLVPVAVLFLVWSTNVYNFMDGLDGFAGGQAVIASMAAAFVCLRNGDTLLAFTMLATCGAAAGFLVWNWPPAKIFMGDCGSGFLGFLFAATAIAAYQHGTVSLASGVVLMIVFLLDATLTLIRRIFQGEEWHKPHRSHAYQLATQLGASHRQVTLVSMAFFTVAAGLAVWAAVPSVFSTVCIVVYAIAIVGVWLVINCLFTGRTMLLTSINRQGVPPTIGGGQRQSGVATEAVAVLYLRFTRVQSKLRSWRTKVSQNDLLEEATGVASRLGYTVSHDWLDGCSGGNCEVAGEKWILLDFSMNKRDQVRQIILAIHDEATKLDALSSDMQAALNRAKTELHSDTKKAA